MTGNNTGQVRKPVTEQVWPRIVAGGLKPALCVMLVCLIACSPERPPQPPRDRIFSRSKITDVDYVQQRLDQGLDPNLTNNQLSNQDRLLTYAVRHGATGTVRLLLSAGADVDSRSVHLNKTPLFQAAFDGHLQIAKILVAHGADVNATDSWGNNPLRDAIVGNDPRMVQFLLQAGSDPDHRNREGETMAEIARAHASPEVEAMFRNDTSHP